MFKTFLATYKEKPTIVCVVNADTILQKADLIELLKGYSNYNILIDYTAEAPLVIHDTETNQIIDVFDYLHNIVQRSDRHPNTVFYVNGNMDIKANYEYYKSVKGIKDEQSLGGVDYYCVWAANQKSNQPDHSSSYDKYKKSVKSYHASFLNATPKWHRAEAIKMLWQKDCLDFKKMRVTYMAKGSDNQEFGGDFTDFPELKKILPIASPQGHGNCTQNLTWNYANISNYHRFLEIFNETYFDVVTETQAGNLRDQNAKPLGYTWSSRFYTEKTWRCMHFKRPFLYVSAPGQLEGLRSLGFRTFDGFLFDESYDKEVNFYKRLVS